MISPLVADGAAFAECPAGKVLVGMGVRVAFGRIDYAIPWGPGNGTLGLNSVMAANNRQISFIPSFVQTVAVCGNASRASRLAKGQVVGVGPAKTSTVACPAGTQLHALGGYVHYPNQTSPVSYAMITSCGSLAAQPNTALVTARELVDNIPPETWGLDVWAVCAP